MRFDEQRLDDADSTVKPIRRRGEGKGTVLRAMERATQSKHYAEHHGVDPTLAEAYVQAARRRKMRKNGRRKNPCKNIISL